jgi:hypothetical protein
MSGLVSFYNENVAKWNVFARKATTAAKATTDSEHSDLGDPIDGPFLNMERTTVLHDVTFRTASAARMALRRPHCLWCSDVCFSHSV